MISALILWIPGDNEIFIADWRGLVAAYSHWQLWNVMCGARIRICGQFADICRLLLLDKLVTYDIRDQQIEKEWN